MKFYKSDLCSPNSTDSKMLMNPLLWFYFWPLVWKDKPRQKKKCTVSYWLLPCLFQYHNTSIRIRDIAPGYYKIYVSIVCYLFVFCLSKGTEFHSHSAFQKIVGITACVPVQRRTSVPERCTLQQTTTATIPRSKTYLRNPSLSCSVRSGDLW